MKKQTNIIVLTLAILISSCSKETKVSKSQVISGSDLKIEWKLITNAWNGRDDSYLQEITITNNSESELVNNGWEIFFSAPPSPVDSILSNDIELIQVQGDLFKLTPKKTFNTVKPGESFSFKFSKVAAFCIKYSDAPCGFYLVDSENKVTNITDLNYAPLLTKEQTSRGSGDNMPVLTSELLFQKNESLQKLDPTSFSKIIPTPTQYNIGSKNELVINEASIIYHSKGLENEAIYLQNALKEQYGLTIKINTGLNSSNENNESSNIILKVGADELKYGKLPSEDGYHLFSFMNNININAKSDVGVLYGIQSLRQLLNEPNDGSIAMPSFKIVDSPRFDYRGMHLDAGRNFHSKEAVLKFLEAMSYYKLNKFHFHLTDDEGWRIEIAGLPELTDVGSKRGHTTTERDMLQPAYGSGGLSDDDSNNGSGYYSREDFIEILKFAKARKIEVIPEIDLPGHSRAAIKAMEARYYSLEKTDLEIAQKYLLTDLNDESEYTSVQHYNDNVICPCQESTYEFMAVVFDDMISMFKEADATFTTMHVGGDEVPAGVWEKSPKCKDLEVNEGISTPNEISSYFLKRLSSMLKDRNLVLAGWEETACNRVELENGSHTYTPNPEFANGHFMPYVWNNVWGWGGEERAYQLANSGYKVVLCNATNLYFDLAYNKNPNEPGYYWAGFGSDRTAFEFTPLNIYNSARENRMGDQIPESNYSKAEPLDKVGVQNIQGIQGHLWSENIKGIDSLEYFYLPKMIGLAERAWSAQPRWEMVNDNQALENDWNKFANSIGHYQLNKLDRISGGYNYRIPPVGIQLNNGEVSANVEYPGLEIRYTNDGSVPNQNSSLYTSAIPESKNMRFRAFSKNGKGGPTTNK